MQYPVRRALPQARPPFAARRCSAERPPLPPATGATPKGLPRRTDKCRRGGSGAPAPRPALPAPPEPCPGAAGRPGRSLLGPRGVDDMRAHGARTAPPRAPDAARAAARQRPRAQPGVGQLHGRVVAQRLDQHVAAAPPLPAARAAAGTVNARSRGFSSRSNSPASPPLEVVGRRSGCCRSHAVSRQMPHDAPGESSRAAGGRVGRRQQPQRVLQHVDAGASVRRIHHQPQPAAGRQHGGQRPQPRRRVRQVVQHAAAVDVVERPEPAPGSSSSDMLPNAMVQAARRGPGPRDAERRRRPVEIA